MRNLVYGIGPVSARVMESLHFQTDECGRLAELAARAGWEMRCIQIEPGEFRGVCDIAQLPGLRICLGNFSPSLRIHAKVPEGWRALTMTDGGACFRGRTLGNGALCYMVPGDPAFWQTPADHVADTVMIETAILDQEVHELGGGSLAKCLPHTAVLGIPPEYLAPLRRLLRAIVSEAASATFEGEHSCRILAKSLVRTLASLLTMPEACCRPPARACPEACHVATVMAFMEGDPGRAWSLRELCQHADVCPRTLQTSFLSQTGVGPNRFVRELRLNRVRSRLRGARRSRESVKQIAIEHGFNHLGHFSRDYVTLFGELPSQTLSNE